MRAKAEAEDPRYARFSEACSHARARAEENAIRTVLGHATDDWRAAAFFLERSFPDKYARRVLQRLEHTGKDGGPITLASLSSLMFDDDTEDDGGD